MYIEKLTMQQSQEHWKCQKLRAVHLRSARDESEIVRANAHALFQTDM